MNLNSFVVYDPDTNFHYTDVDERDLDFGEAFISVRRDFVVWRGNKNAVAKISEKDLMQAHSLLSFPYETANYDFVRATLDIYRIDSIATPLHRVRYDILKFVRWLKTQNSSLIKYLVDLGLSSIDLGEKLTWGNFFKNL